MVPMCSLLLGIYLALASWIPVLLTGLASPWSIGLKSPLFACRAGEQASEKGSKEGSTLNRYVLRGQQDLGAENRADVTEVKGAAWLSLQGTALHRLPHFPLEMRVLWQLEVIPLLKYSSYSGFLMRDIFFPLFFVFVNEVLSKAAQCQLSTWEVRTPTSVRLG